MTEHPILFSGPMVRAILEGRKTQTQRVINPQPNTVLDVFQYQGEVYAQTNLLERERQPMALNGCIKCPYGQPGDVLCVRETWVAGRPALPSGAGIILPEPNPTPGMKVLYRADGDNHVPPIPWRPSIFMPRWASRVTLEITAVRAERLQDISRDDAIAEGVIPMGGFIDDEPWCASLIDQEPMRYPQAAYGRLWNSINGKSHPWANNDWVWVIEFKRLKK